MTATDSTTIEAGTTDSGEHLTVVHDAADRYFELHVDGNKAGLLVYENAPGRRVFNHTFINDGYRGRNLVTPFLTAALDELRKQNLSVTNYCPVIAHFIETHPEYAAVLDREHPGTWPAPGPIE